MHRSSRQLRRLGALFFSVTAYMLLAAVPALAAPDFDGDGVADGDCKPLDGGIYPGALDKPDLSFEDTNCDGIDGDAAKAVFVSASAANNSGSGSKENPVRDFSFALDKAEAEGKDVYAITGTYEQGSIALRTNVGVYGGYQLVTGARTNSEPTLIKGSPQAMLADGDTNVTLQLLKLEATADGARSAYGMRAINGSTVVLQKVNATAGDGLAGTSGANGTTGKAGENGATGGGGVCTVDVGQDKPQAAGGAGGDSFIFFPFIANLPGHDGGDGGVGGAFGENPGSGGSGAGPDGQSGGTAPANHSGNSGNSGTSVSNTPPTAQPDGANATFPDTTNSNVWVGAAGVAGANGHHGSGGGAGSGGAVRSDTSSAGGWNDAGGGGGGGGGEGGAGGGGGGAGGAGGGSFGVFAHDSSVVVTNSTLTSGNGGAGGNGGTGANGGARGTGAIGGPGASCEDGDGSAETGGSGGSGGHGQPGGKGGAGGGGAGGPSFGVYVSGTGQFVNKSNTIANGTAGQGGLKGGTVSDRAEDGQSANTAGGTESTTSDFDGDGVADVSDSCPSINGGGASDGCPARPGALSDGDGDGVPDNADACPGAAAGTDANFDGCQDGVVAPVDADGDGIQPPIDCDDNNAGIKPNTAEIPDNQVDENCDGIKAFTPPVRITSGIDFLFDARNKRFTKVNRLTATNVPVGATVTVRCKAKKGCKFKTKKVLAKKAGKVNLKRFFNYTKRVKRKRRKIVSKLRGGTLVVSITKPGAIGKVVTFKILKGKVPTFKVTCLPVGSTKPQANC